MRKIVGIVESSVTPPTNVIWLYNGVAKYFSDGKWIEIGGNPVSINNPSQGVAITAPVIKLGNSDEDRANNVEVCSRFGITEIVSVDVEGIIGGFRYDAVGIYHNGTVSILEGNKCTVFDINFNTGQVTLDSKYDTSRLLPYIDLEIGNSDTTKAYNMERLQTGTFFCDIDYGFGVGTWNSTTGGTAHIVTVTGNTVYYDISNDGIVAKDMESPDLYYEYTQMGGTKSAAQFAMAIKGLVDS